MGVREIASKVGLIQPPLFQGKTRIKIGFDDDDEDEIMWNGLRTDCFVVTNMLKLLACLFAQNTTSQSAWPGDWVIFLTRAKPNVGRLRRPGAVRAQPCI